MYDPFKEAVERGITVGVTPDLPGVDAWWIQDETTILLRAGLDSRQLRVMCAHMLAHLRLDHVPTPKLLDRLGNRARRQELEAARLTARRLIPIPELFEALRTVGTSAARLAEHLDVTLAALAKRMRNLDDDEWQILRALDRYQVVWPEENPYGTTMRCSITASLFAPAPSLDGAEILRAC